MTTKTITIPDLTPFCGPLIERYPGIAAPFRLDGDDHVCATDGRILLRIDPVVPPDVGLPDGKTPSLVCFREVVAPVEAVKKWSELPEPKACKACDSVGLTALRCDCCRGTGYVFMPDSRFEKCRECVGGVNWYHCQKCYVEFGNRWLGQWYVNLCRMLSDARFGVADDDPEGPVLIKFAGGIGVLMPVS